MTTTNDTKKKASKRVIQTATTSKAGLFEMDEQPNKSRDRTLSELAVDGVLGNASTLELFNRGSLGELSLTDCTAVLKEKGTAVNRGDMRSCEVVLTAQAAALNAIFNELARRAALNMGQHLGATETYLRLAMKAQSQCRSTIETLSDMKSPPVVFARQANIANGPQQVNNGVPAVEQNARPVVCVGEKQIGPNELFKEISNGWTHLDTRTTATTGGTDSTLAPMGAINRPAQ